MNFGDINFIFLFLPIFVIIHYIVPQKAKNAVLFAGSTVFYFLAVGEYYEWIILLLISVLMNWYFGKFIHLTDGRSRKTVLWLGIMYTAALLVFFKYSSTILPFAYNILGQRESIIPSFMLPIGISFYTFKNISYLHEVYSEKVEYESSVINYGAYLMMFPQISMGPIQTYSSFKPYIFRRDITSNGVNEGLVEFILGFGLKQILANRFAIVWNGIETIGYDSISTPLAWMGIIGFSLQLYFDFYGYSLMASGIGRMLGYDTPKNFDYPYCSSSMSEFWRRWHMTLGAWFKENIYIPLGGNRCGKLCLYRNLFAVWLMTGMWHGDTLNFVFWGLFLFALIAIEKSGAVNFIITNKFVSHIYVIFTIIISWLFFKLPTMSDFVMYLSRMIPIFTETPEFVNGADYLKYVNSTGLIYVVGIIFCTPAPRLLFEKLKSKKWISIPILLVIFWYSVYSLACGSNDPFLYGNF